MDQELLVVRRYKPSKQHREALAPYVSLIESRSHCMEGQSFVGISYSSTKNSAELRPVNLRSLCCDTRPAHRGPAGDVEVARVLGKFPPPVCYHGGTIREKIFITLLSCRFVDGKEKSQQLVKAAMDCVEQPIKS